MMGAKFGARHVKRFAADVQTQCLWQFDAPVSPHLAAQAQPAPSVCRFSPPP